jgi:hypothetical protein
MSVTSSGLEPATLPHMWTAVTVQIVPQIQFVYRNKLLLLWCLLLTVIIMCINELPGELWEFWELVLELNLTETWNLIQQTPEYLA